MLPPLLPAVKHSYQTIKYQANDSEPMEKQITLTAGECELVSRLTTQAIANGDLQQREGREARRVREKIVEEEIVLKI